MAQAQVVAHLSVLSGQAFVRDSAGNTRRLKLGDAIREGESVVAADGAKVVLALADGREMAIRPGETAKIDSEVAAQIKPDAADSSVANDPQGFQKIVAALKSGNDLDSLLEEEAPAAGLVGQGGNEGHTFVELLRIVETVDPLAFQFGTYRGRPIETIEGAPLKQSAALDAINDSNSLQINGTASGSVLANDTNPLNGQLTVTGFSIDINGDGVSEVFTPGQLATIAGVGSLSIAANGAYTFVPVHNYAGPIPVASYAISDGQGGSDTASLVLTIIPNAAPDAINDGPIAVHEDTPVSGNVLANDTDQNGNPLLVTGFSIDTDGDGVPELFVPGQIATIIGVGTLFIGTDGAYTFTPASNYYGPVPVATYDISDGLGGVDTAMLILGPVTPVNDAPVPVVTPASGDEDTPIVVNLSGTDPDGTVQSVTVTILPPASEGVLYLPDGVTTVAAGTPLTPSDAAHLVFVPALDFNGPVNISFTVTDNQGLESVPAIAPIMVNPVVDPVISIDDVTVNEAAGTMTFTVTLDQPTSATVSVNFATTPGSAVSPQDFTSVGGVLTFAPGVVTQVVTVNIKNDGIYEGSETFNVNLTSPVNATIGDGLGIGTIKDDGTGVGGTDDDRPTLSISNPTVAEDGGHAVFTLSLSNASTIPTTVSLALGNGTASSPADYTTGLEVSTDGGVTWTPANSATFAAGVTSVLARTPIVDDNLAESAETFTLTATTTAGATANPSAVGTASITDNDTPAFSINDVTVNEGAGTITFTVTLSNPSATATTVAYDTTPGTASTPADYAAGVDGLTGTLSFAAGVTSQTITLNIANDTVYEGAETLNVNLSGATGGATISDALGIGTIMDDGTGTGGSNDDRPQVGSVSSPTVVEGGNLDFAVTLTTTSTTPTVVTLTPASGSATLGTDTSPLQVSFDGGTTWSPVVGSTVTVPAGNPGFLVRVPTVDDNISEPTETLTLSASTAQNLAPVQGTGSITDNDGTPTLALTGPALVNEAAGTLTYTVTLSNPSASTVTVGYNTADGTATVAGNDYVASTGTLSFAPGETVKTFTVAINNDNTYEGNENYSVNLAAPVNATIATGTVSTTIADDGTGVGGSNDDRPQVGSISSPTVAEGGNLDFAVTLTHPSTTPTVVTLTPASGSATLGTDTSPLQVSFDGGLNWSPVVGSTVSVPAGNTDFIVRVPTVDDNISEPTETMTLGAATAQNAAPVVGTGSITDNDGTPSLSIDDVTVNEAAGTATFTVTLSNPSAGTVTVGYNTSDGTATVAGNDYDASTGSLTFAPGVVTQVVTVNIKNDGIYEGSETFNVNLTSPVNATIGDGLGIGTIKDDGTGVGGTDDDRPTLSISNPTVAEDGGHAVFTLSLSNASTIPTTVSLALGNGTASSPADYTTGLEVSTDGGVTWTPANSATFAAGVTSVLARTPIVDDNLAESAETFTLTATTTAGATANPSAVGTASITDNDTPAFSINDVTVNEGAGTITFTVTLSNPSATATTVAYDTTPGTASTPADYAAGVDGLTGTLSFAAGVTSQTITLNIANDTVYEGAETLNVNLSGATGGATISDALGIGTIMDDGTGTGGSNDDRPQVGSVSSPTVVEGGNLDFAVTLTTTSTTPTVVTLTPASGSATLGTDTSPLQVSFDGGTTWSPVVGSTVTVPAGNPGFLVRVPTVDDNISEPTETLTLSASTAQNLAPVQGTGSITDNDGTPTLALTGPALVNEAAGTLTYTVTLSNPSASTVTVGYNTADGTATVAGNDYVASTGTLSFAPGETVKTFTVAINNDNTYEGNENYSVNLAAPVNATIATGTVSTTIADDGTGVGGSNDDRPQVGSISSPTVAEGGNLDFAVTLTHPSTTPTVVTLTPASGSATLGTDTSPLQVSFDGGLNWSPVVGSTVSVPAGNTDFIVRVPTVDDNISEPTETMTLGAATAQNAAPVVGTGSITDNDGTPSLSIDDVTVNEAAGTATFTVTLSNPSAGTVTVGYNTSDGTATVAGNDYDASTGSLTFAPGVVTQVVTVNIKNDGIYEGSETFNVNLTSPVNATIGDGLGIGTIKDDGTGVGGTDDDRPTLSISNPTVAEDGGHAVFTLSLSNASTIPTTVSLALGNGTASSPADYTTGLEVSTDGGVTWTPANSATFAAGVTSVLARTPIVDDNLAESAETFTLTATTTAGATANPSAVGTASITDNDTPAFSINDVTVNEGAGTITFTVTLSNPSATATTVAYDTTPGTASTPADYAAGVDGLTGTLSFAAGVTSQTITLNIANDTVYEGAETLNVNLSGATGGATISDALGIGTIMDDGTGTGGSNDDRPQVGSVSSPTVVEGGNLDFAVTLTTTSTTPTVVTLTPASGSATLGTDTSPLQVSFDGGTTWSPVVGSTVTVPAGNPGFLVRVPTVDDNISEPTETLTLSASTAQNLAPVQGTGSITDNDGTPTLALTGPALVNEAAGTLTYTVTLSNPSASTVTVGYNTADGTATVAGNDYVASTGTLSFAPGETVKTFTVAINNDNTYEGNENYSVNLAAPVNATIATGTVSTTIADDGTGVGGSNDDRPQVGSISSPTVAEGGNLDFAVTLTHPSTTPTVVTLTPASGSATLGTDTSPLQVSFDGGLNWSPVVGSTVSVPAGNTDFIVRVPTVDDNISEPTETMTLGAATAQNAAPVVGTGSITDNDGTPSLSIDDVTVNEAAGTATFTVTLSNPSAGTVTVGYNTSDGTATVAGNDYDASTGSLTFAPGVVTQVVTVNIKNDGIYEGSETFNVNLTSPVNATIGDGLGIGTIKDDGTGVGGTDDDRPRVSSIDSPTVVEGGNLDFNVIMSNISTTPTTVTLTPASGTATLGTDTSPLQVSFDGGASWTPLVGTTVSIPAGSGGFIVRVPTVNDTLGEANETMTLTASTPLGQMVGTGTITDNDTPVVNISGPVTYNEAAGTATFTVTLSNASALPVSVAFSTANGTATAGSDYTANAGTLNFAAGVISQTITVAIANDTVYEGAETFNVNLSTPSNATLGTATSTATIIDDGTGIGGTNSDIPSLSVNSVSVLENVGYAVFTVSLSNASALATTVNLGLANGTAVTPSDFTNSIEVSTNGGATWVTATSATLVAGATSLLARVPIVNDSLDENNETFTLLATRTSGVTSNAVASGAATIIDNDSTPVPTVDTKTVLEDIPASGNVLTNDTDADGDVLSVTQFVINGTTYAANATATLVGIGTLRMNGDGSYVFTPAPDYNGSVPVVTYTVSDGTNTATSTLTISMTPLNDAPAGTNKTITTLEDVSYVLTVADFGFTDPKDSPANAFQSVTVNAPSTGTLMLNGVLVTAATIVPVSEITAGHLIYTPAANANANGTPSSNFTFQVTDDGGTANGGQNTDQSPNTITFNVTPAIDLSAKWIDYWQFNEGAGSGTINYNPAVDQFGTITNNMPHSSQPADPVADLRPTWTTGRNDSTAIQFNGVGGASAVRDGGWVALATSVTDPLAGQTASKAASLSFWIKTTQVGSNIGWDSPSVIGMENNGGQVDVQWGFINNQGKIGFGIGDNAGLMSNNAINDNQWHSVTISHDFTTGRTYMWVDGTAQAFNGTILAAGSVAPNKFLGFGVTADDGNTSDRFLNAALEDVRIYDGVLTTAQAQAIYETELWGSQSSVIANDGHAIHFSLGVNDATSIVLSGLVAGTTVADVTGAHTGTVGAGGTLDISTWGASEVVLSNYGTSSFHVSVTGTDAVGNTASQLLSVVNSADMYAGTTGNDTLNASANANAHVLAGGSGNDSLIGGAGVDVLIGGTGNDTLNGGGGADVIRWNYADRGGVDTVQNFGTAAGSDALDLRDLLQGEIHTASDAGNLANYLHFSVAAGSTTVEVKSAGSGAVDQTIILSGVDLVTGVTASAGQTIDQAIIHNLLNNGKLITD